MIDGFILLWLVWREAGCYKSVVIRLRYHINSESTLSWYTKLHALTAININHYQNFFHKVQQQNSSHCLKILSVAGSQHHKVDVVCPEYHHWLSSVERCDVDKRGHSIIIIGITTSPPDQLLCKSLIKIVKKKKIICPETFYISRQCSPLPCKLTLTTQYGDWRTRGR